VVQVVQVVILELNDKDWQVVLVVELLQVIRPLWQVVLVLQDKVMMVLVQVLKDPAVVDLVAVREQRVP
jgi:hypothetical protein